MEKINIVVFVSDCGRQFKSKQSCKRHELACKCFSNPKYRACHSCVYNGGIEKEDGYFFRNCKHPQYDYDAMTSFNIPNTKSGDCINCPLYVPEKQHSLEYEKWIQNEAVNDIQAHEDKITDYLPF